MILSFLSFIKNRNTCKASVRLTGLSNAFSSGIFLGIAIFHLLPEAQEGFENYFTENKVEGFITRIPIAYFLIISAFSLILFIEKIAFDSHALIEHDHGDGGHGHSHDHDHDHDTSQNELKTNRKSSSDDEEENNDSDDEEVMKNLISSQGKVGSFLMESNQRK